jgi:hypothetical protein
MDEKEIEFIVDSNPNSGSINLSTPGDSFEVQLEDSFHIPENSIDLFVSVQDATIWWTVPNVITGSNDILTIIDDRGVQDIVTVTIPQGLYGLAELNNAIERYLVNNGKAVLIQLSSDSATQKVEIIANYADITIDFTVANSINELIGFEANTYGPSTVTGQKFLAPNVANFNTVNYFLMHSDICDRGIPFNGKYSQTIAKILIDVTPGSQITYTPFNPSKTHCKNLKNSRRLLFRYWITDDQNRSLNTNSEYWSARIKLTYKVPIELKI